MEAHSTIEPLVKTFIKQMMIHYWTPMHNYVVANPELTKTAPGFLLNLEEVVVHIGRTHIAVEYTGPEYTEELKRKGLLKLEYHDYSTKECNLLEQIIGFKNDSTVDWSMPLPALSEDLLLPTNRGWDKLSELGWNFSAQDSIMGFNNPTLILEKGRFSRIVNGMFFDANDSGLKTRRIKWIDFHPISFDGSDSKIDTISFSLERFGTLAIPDAHYVYPLPNDYKFIQLPKINRFIEIWGNNEKTETDITSFLSEPENNFILTMKFGAVDVKPEATCEWQSEDRKDIRPDFFVVQPDGYADIVEFKLPNISRNPVVGSTNRETLSAWLNSYISQTRVYSSYFEDPNNRKWFESKYGIKVYKPRRWLVVGRRHDFDSDVWREIISDYKDLEILTFDDLVDGVAVQFYK